MKKIGLILVCMLLLTSVSVFAADVTIGGAVGLSHNWLGGSDWDDILKESDISNQFRLGFEIGAFFDIAVNELFSVQPELNFLLMRAGAGATIGGIDMKETFTVKAFEIPVLAKFKFEAGNGNFCFFFGPALQIILGDVGLKAEVDGDSIFDETEAPDNSTIFSGIVGVGYEIPMGDGTLSFDLRYRRQFTGLIDEINLRFNTIGLRVGYGFAVR